MLEKRRGYAYRRPSYPVDPNAAINAGMVAFLTTINGVVTATTAPSGDTPIGTFWSDSNLSYVRSTLETHTFDSNDQVSVNGGNFQSTGTVKVTNAAGTVTYTQGTDYSVNINSGVITRIGTGSITASQSVVVWYAYNITLNNMKQLGYGTNYDQAPNDTMGSNMIAVAEGWAHFYTDQFDVTQNYTLNAALRSDANSLWSTDATTGYSVTGRVLKVPTASDPLLGIVQVVVTA